MSETSIDRCHKRLKRKLDKVRSPVDEINKLIKQHKHTIKELKNEIEELEHKRDIAKLDLGDDLHLASQIESFFRIFQMMFYKHKMDSFVVISEGAAEDDLFFIIWDIIKTTPIIQFEDVVFDELQERGYSGDFLRHLCRELASISIESLHKLKKIEYYKGETEFLVDDENDIVNWSTTYFDTHHDFKVIKNAVVFDMDKIKQSWSEFATTKEIKDGTGYGYYMGFTASSIFFVTKEYGEEYPNLKQLFPTFFKSRTK